MSAPWRKPARIAQHPSWKHEHDACSPEGIVDIEISKRSKLTSGDPGSFFFLALIQTQVLEQCYIAIFERRDRFFSRISDGVSSECDWFADQILQIRSHGRKRQVLLDSRVPSGLPKWLARITRAP